MKSIIRLYILAAIVAVGAAAAFALPAPIGASQGATSANTASSTGASQGAIVTNTTSLIGASQGATSANTSSSIGASEGATATHAPSLVGAVADSLISDFDWDNDTLFEGTLGEVTVAKRMSGRIKLSGAENSFRINQNELFKAACCNLGESFTTNPSVDVNYADPATGAKQIKLLGLDGSYVQLLSENLPMFRGASRPYALRYVPGPWLKSISVSKGASSVKNGYESMSGQINVEYLKPDDEQGVTLNAFTDSQLRTEFNADGNIHVAPGLSTELLAHYEDRLTNHDGNGDGFSDLPDIRQLNLHNRWKLVRGRYIFHGGIGVLNEESRAGQLGHSPSTGTHSPYLIDLFTRRYEGYLKNAYVLDREHNSNIALMLSGSYHDLDATYGLKRYTVGEWNGYGQLIYETDFTRAHNLSAGLSLNLDTFDQHMRTSQDASAPLVPLFERETSAGGYAQYTFKPSAKLTAMAGVRADWSSRFGWFATPRVNVRYTPVERLNLRVSTGKGYRTVHPWAEYNYLMASGRKLIADNLNQEAAWNYGINADYTLELGMQTLRLNAEYYYTKFLRQAVVNFETPGELHIENLSGRSYSHTFQVDATLETSFGLSATAAWRLNDVRTTYNGLLLEKPLSSRYKGLLTLSYATDMNLWQFDATLQLNGGGRLPAPYETASGEWSWGRTFPAFPQLNAQVTRWFRRFSVYIGGENLTGFRQKNPIIWSHDPWSPNFDSTLTWGPTHGAMAYMGIRFNFGKL